MKALSTAVILIATVLIVSLTGCSENSELLTNKISESDAKISFRGDDPPHSFFDLGGTNYGCDVPAINCWADIIVVGDKLDIVNDIFSNIGTWTDAQLRTYVDDNSVQMADLIGEDETAGIISGAYALSTKGTSSTDKRYMLTKAGTSIVTVTAIDN